jgi:hypothetical protein
VRWYKPFYSVLAAVGCEVQAKVYAAEVKFWHEGKRIAGNSVPTSYYGAVNPFAYYRLSGTSMAAAAVSGAVADLLQAQPTLTPDQVKARLMKTAYKTFPQSSTASDPVTGATYISCYDIFTVGAGYLDLAAALASTYTPSGNSLSPTATFNTSAGPGWDRR